MYIYIYIYIYMLYIYIYIYKAAMPQQSSAEPRICMTSESSYAQSTYYELPY